MRTSYSSEADVRADVEQALATGPADGINVAGIVGEIVQTVGVGGYAGLGPETFWAIVRRHDATEAGEQ